MSRLAPILEKLAHAQSRMLGTADEVPADQWRTRPKDGGWSAAEIVGHLIMVERSVVGSADRVIQHPPEEVFAPAEAAFPARSWSKRGS